MHAREYYEAIAFITEAHAGETYGGLPFWIHPLAVADTLTEFEILDRVPLLGALLHDVAEDTAIPISVLEARFGADVAGAVAEVTDDPELSKSDRHEQQIARAATMRLEAVAIKAADRLVNLSELGGRTPSAYRVQHSRRLHDALLARCEELDGGPAPLKLLRALDRRIRELERGA